MVLTLERPEKTVTARRARADARPPAADADVRPTPYITAEEFATIWNASGLELIDGRIVERERGNRERWISGEIFGLIRDHVKPIGAGWVYPTETAFQCFGPKRDRVRKPDAAFVRRDRLPGGTPPFENLQIALDLVVEVVSPSDGSEVIDRKVEMYLDAGVPLLWVVFPLPAHPPRPPLQGRQAVPADRRRRDRRRRRAAGLQVPRRRLLPAPAARGDDRPGRHDGRRNRVTPTPPGRRSSRPRVVFSTRWMTPLLTSTPRRRKANAPGFTAPGGTGPSGC